MRKFHPLFLSVAILIIALGQIEDFFGYLERFGFDIGIDELRERFGYIWWLVHPLIFLIVSYLAVFLYQFTEKPNTGRILSDTELEGSFLLLRKHLFASLTNQINNKTLTNTGKIDLNLKIELDAVEYRPDLANTYSGKVDDLLSYYKRSGYQLLILGEAGAGKSTIIQELALSYLQDSKTHASQTLPIVLLLSTWEKEMTIGDWVANQLNKDFNFPKDKSLELLIRGQISLFLDGFDEIEESDRDLFVKEIQNHIETDGIPGLVIASRTTEYIELGKKVRLRGAIRILPLSDSDIFSYIKSAGPRQNGLVQALKLNTDMLEMARSPFMLNIMCSSYEGIRTEDITWAKNEESITTLPQLFDIYLIRAFQHDRDKSYPIKDKERTLKSLTWIACKLMTNSSDTVFYIEDLQTSWLEKKQLKKYNLTFSALTCIFYGPVLFTTYGLIFGIASSIIFGIFSQGELHMSNSTYYLGDSISNRMISWFIFVVSGLSSIGLFLGIFLFFAHSLSTYWSSDELKKRIEIQEVIGWSWKNFCVFIPIHSLVALAMAYILHWISDLSVTTEYIFAWCVFVFVMSTQNGIIRKETKRVSAPNGRIINSFRSLLRMTFIIAPVIALIVGISASFFFELSTSLIYGGAAGLYVFMLHWGKIGDGQGFLRHYALRYVFYLDKNIPFKLVDFLETGRRLIFLKRNGGAYMFIHKQLQEYFAGLTVSKTKELVEFEM